MLTDLLLFCVVTVAAISDLRSRRVPNRLLAGGLAAAFMLQAFAPGGDLMLGAGGMLTGLLVFLPFYLLKGMGAGDVKLMATIGAYAGPAATLRISLATFVAGGLVCIAWWLAQRRHAGVMAGKQAGMHIPYAVAIALGTLAGWNWTTAING